MKVNGKHYRTIWMEGSSVFMIEQNLLPFEFRIFESSSYSETCEAIRTMIVRGAGAIGAAAGFAMAQAFIEFQNDESRIQNAKHQINATRPTARNLFYASERVYKAGIQFGIQAAVNEAQSVADENVANSREIARFGEALIKDDCRILTHCNAGWLGFVDYGSALAPVYLAHEKGKKIFVYADETRPRSQGARLTAWELYNEQIPHRIIPDNAGAWLMSQGKVDLIIVGADRIAANGDVANKIGTLGKAIVAKEFGIPFYVAAPSSTFDLNCTSGNDITIEERSEDEILYQTGITRDGRKEEILVCNPGSSALNPAFDVTPAKYITGIITEKGIILPKFPNIINLNSKI